MNQNLANLLLLILSKHLSGLQIKQYIYEQTLKFLKRNFV